ncbi:MAG: hypothetical protein KF805_05925 [Phycisphaeraceae bacterium]|nr:hypothetical protein [Phycisphaeraceae bacterium]
MPEGTPPPEDGGSPPSTLISTTRPPASEETDWRARALEAESKLAALEAESQSLRTQLDQTHAALAQEKQSREIDRALASAGAIDPEVASLLLASMLATQTGDPTTPPDITALVQTMRAQKPFLFESALPPRPIPSAMSPAITTTPTDSLHDLAVQARTTGDRRALLAYLRARRAMP